MNGNVNRSAEATSHASVVNPFHAFMQKIGARHLGIGEGNLALVYESGRSNLLVRKIVRIERVWDRDPFALTADGSSSVKPYHRSDLFPINPKDLTELTIPADKCVGADLIPPTSYRPRLLASRAVILHPHRAVETTGSWTPSGNKASFIGKLGILETEPNRDGKYIVTLLNDNLSFLMSSDEFSHLKLTS